MASGTIHVYRQEKQIKTETYTLTFDNYGNAASPIQDKTIINVRVILTSPEGTTSNRYRYIANAFLDSYVLTWFIRVWNLGSATSGNDTLGTQRSKTLTVEISYLE